MSLFTVITDAKAIIADSKGGRYQVDMYQRTHPNDGKTRVYIKKGAAFYYLRRDGGTSLPGIKWEELVWAGKERFDDMGRMVTNDTASA